MPRRFAWAALSDDELLRLRLKDLKVTVEGTWLQRCLNDLNDELAERASHPPACLDIERVVQPRRHARHCDPLLSRASPPDAARAEDDHRRRRRDRPGVHAYFRQPATCCKCPISCSADADGRSCSAGRRPAIPAIIGQTQPAAATSTTCRWYAQSHPDEDFAETFAVWLTPRSNWRKRYAGWPAWKKLQYVDELMGRSPPRSRRSRAGCASTR